MFTGQFIPKLLLRGKLFRGDIFMLFAVKRDTNERISRKKRYHEVALQPAIENWYFH